MILKILNDLKDNTFLYDIDVIKDMTNTAGGLETEQKIEELKERIEESKERIEKSKEKIRCEKNLLHLRETILSAYIKEQKL